MSEKRRYVAMAYHNGDLVGYITENDELIVTAPIRKVLELSSYNDGVKLDIVPINGEN